VKPGRPLQRKTPLARGGPLERKTPLRNRRKAEPGPVDEQPAEELLDEGPAAGGGQPQPDRVAPRPGPRRLDRRASTTSAGGAHDHNVDQQELRKMRRSPGRRRPGPTRTVEWIVDCRAAGGIDDGRPPWCEWPDCDQVGVHRHHRLNRKDGGRHGAMADLVNGPAWLLKLCAHHHHEVTVAHGAELKQFRDDGWLLMEGQHAELVPVRTRWWPDPIWLAGDGSWSTTPPDPTP
jgi:hypothetical protein